MPKTYRVGIIGHTGRGDYGHAVDVAFLKVPRAEVVAVADPSEAGRAAAQKRTGAKAGYADYREMLAKEKPDVVGVCTRWIDQHRDVLLAAAATGCHVYMEKPFCRTPAECDEVIRALDSKHLKLGIAHISQYSPVLDTVKKLLADGLIGDVLELRGRGKEDRRGGAEDLWVLGSHVFGLMRSLAGGDPVSCSATLTVGGRPVVKADVRDGAEGLGPLAGDHVQATYTFPKGVTGFFASRKGMGVEPSRFGLQVFGSKGVLEMVSGYGARAYLLRDPGWSPGRTNTKWEFISSGGVGVPEPRKDGGYEGGHVAAINDLLDAAEERRETRCSARDAAGIVQMITAVFESHRQGKPVELPLKTRSNPLALLP